MEYLAMFFAGVFLCNCIPHIVCGLKGELFPSPFSRPPGFGPTSPPLNVIWGFVNLLAGLWLLTSHPFIFGLNNASIAFFAGALILGLCISWHFGRVRAQNEASKNAH